MSDASEGIVYRVVQEALRNVVSHSGATAVRVAINSVDGEVRVVVDDDGQGFSAEEVLERNRAGHVGLRALGDLLANAGGRFEVLSRPETGTRILAAVPERVMVPS